MNRRGGKSRQTRRGKQEGSWFLVLGSWFLVLGSWFLVLGSWFLVVGGWFLSCKSKARRDVTIGTRSFVSPPRACVRSGNAKFPPPLGLSQRSAAPRQPVRRAHSRHRWACRCPAGRCSSPNSDVCWARSIAQRGQAPLWRRPRRDHCWRGATLDGDMPRRGVLAPASRLYSFRQRNRGLTGSPLKLARSEARIAVKFPPPPGSSQPGAAPRQIALVAGRGASPNGGKPRCGGVPAGIIVGGEQRSTGTCPVVACSPRPRACIRSGNATVDSRGDL